MRIFQHANLDDKNICLICKKPEDKPVILAGIVGTEEGNNIQANQVHVDCIDLLYYPEANVIAQKVEPKQKDEKII